MSLGLWVGTLSDRWSDRLGYKFFLCLIDILFYSQGRVYIKKIYIVSVLENKMQHFTRSVCQTQIPPIMVSSKYVQDLESTRKLSNQSEGECKTNPFSRKSWVLSTQSESECKETPFLRTVDLRPLSLTVESVSVGARGLYRHDVVIF